MPARVAVIDDERFFADAMAGVLRELAGCQVVGVGSSARHALEIVKSTRPDVLLIDYHLPDVSATEVIRRVRAVQPGLKVIVLTGNPSDLVREECLRVGADQVILKKGDLEQVVGAFS